jgi:hypothetical protein
MVELGTPIVCYGRKAFVRRTTILGLKRIARIEVVFEDNDERRIYKVKDLVDTDSCCRPDGTCIFTDMEKMCIMNYGCCNMMDDYSMTM